MSAETVSAGPAGVEAVGVGAPAHALRAFGDRCQVPDALIPDALTGLPGRATLTTWLADRAGIAARAAGPGAESGSDSPGGEVGGLGSGPDTDRIGLLCLDLDGFRQVNAMLGFGAGDRFLAAVAERLAGVTGPGGHLLARTGGDEFAVLVNLAGCCPNTAAGAGAATDTPHQDSKRSATGAAHQGQNLARQRPDRIRPVPSLAVAESVQVQPWQPDPAGPTGPADQADSAATRSGNPSPTAVTHLAHVAEHILAALRAPVRVDGRALTVTASIGAVETAAHATCPEELLRAADLALYWAKGEGRDRWTLFDAERGGADVDRYRLAADLPEAVDSGQFFCEYQPIVALADGTVAGVEALVRWRHPRYGLVSPDRFIALAEESGLIVELGRRILAEACRAAAGWPDAPGQPAPPVSVNVAVRQMRDPGLTGHVLAALEAVGLPPARLRLEITESALLPGDDTAVAVLRSLADRGVHIAVDDFGTGYSNLAHLRRLPVRILKIDGTFVAGLTASGPPGPDEQIIATVTALGHALGLSVTAEGVETAEQWETVRRLGVDTGQGWYFSRALSAAGIRDLLASGLPLAA